MTESELIAECQKLAPDFTVERKVITIHGHVQVYASCTLRGEPHEMSVVLPPGTPSNLEHRMLTVCLQSMRRLTQ